MQAGGGRAEGYRDTLLATVFALASQVQTAQVQVSPQQSQLFLTEATVTTAAFVSAVGLEQQAFSTFSSFTVLMTDALVEQQAAPPQQSQASPALALASQVQTTQVQVSPQQTQLFLTFVLVSAEMAGVPANAARAKAAIIPISPRRFIIRLPFQFQRA